MGGRGASSAGGAANVRKVRDFLMGEGFGVISALQHSSESKDFDEAWENLMHGRSYPTDFAASNRKSYNASKSKAKSAISSFIDESGMNLEDLRSAIMKNWS